MLLKKECKIFTNITFDTNPVNYLLLKPSKTIQIKRLHVNSKHKQKEVEVNDNKNALQNSISLLLENSFPNRNINIKNYKNKYRNLMKSRCGELMIGVASKLEKLSISKEKERNKPIFHTKIKEFKLSKSCSTISNTLQTNVTNNAHKKTRNYHPIKSQFGEYNELTLKDKLFNIMQKVKETNKYSIDLDKEMKIKFRNKFFNKKTCKTNNTNENKKGSTKLTSNKSQKLFPMLHNYSHFFNRNKSKNNILPNKKHKYNGFCTIYDKYQNDVIN